MTKTKIVTVNLPPAIYDRLVQQAAEDVGCNPTEHRITREITDYISDRIVEVVAWEMGEAL